MKKFITLLVVLSAVSMSLRAAEITVIDDGSGTGTVTWTSDNVYILDGFVFVNDGQTLTIEAGTVIKGKPGQEENASALIVARGGQLIAEGTASDPIIFTAEADDLAGSVNQLDRGLWGGLILLGKASTNNATTEKAIEGIPTEETRGLYGQGDGPVEDDGSAAIMKYVSARHGGTDIGEGNEINGVTLGACGSGTEISYLEVLSNKDDGVEFFGGVPRLDHILVAYCADDSYDYDEGFSGYGQFWAVLQDPLVGDRMGEHDGGPSSNELGTPYAHPVIFNATYIGRGAGAGKRAITFRDNAAGEYHNSIFVNQEKGIDIEFRGADGGSYDRFSEGNLALANNIFYNVADGSAAGIFKVVSEQDDVGNDLYSVTQSELDVFSGSFAGNGNIVADPQVTLDHPTPKGDVGNPVYPEGLDEWFSRVGYKGAFEPDENWAYGWSESLGQFEPDPRPAGEIIVQDDGSGTGTVTWTSNNTYILDGFVFVNDGQVLTIEAGTVIKGKPGQEENASALIVARGGQLIAEGTVEDPIIFTAEADDLQGSVNDTDRGLWGGLILLGKGLTNNGTTDKAIEGIPTGETRGLYGGDVEDDNSGTLKYISLRHGGTDIGEGNEINGLTLGATGTATSVSYLEVVSNKDDGVEWFGGAPKFHHILVAWCADDSYDYDEGYSGWNQFLCAIQDPLTGDRLGEHDGGPSSNELGTPIAHPVFSNVTYVGRGAAEGKRTITFRDNAGGEYHNSIFASQAKGIDIEFRGADGGSYDRFAEGNLALAGNIFFDVADGTAAGIFKVVSEQDDDGNDLYTVTQTELDAFSASFADNGNTADVDPVVTADNPTAGGDIFSIASFAGMNDWFERVDYVGAFAPGVNWAAGWTLSLGDVNARNNPFVGMEDMESYTRSVSVYPNPVLDVATVEFENEKGASYSFTLYDLSGRSVRVISDIRNGYFRFDREGLSSGIYVYRLSGDDGRIMEGKLVMN
ncbi:MAG: T9SS type A sorting domain-containing protein [Bacteroidales bacterium]